MKRPAPTHTPLRLHTLRSAREGAWLGLVSGVLLLVAQMIAAGAAGHGDAALSPLRAAAGIVAGRSALTSMTLGLAALIGLAVHVALSVAFGFLYGLWNGHATAAARRSWARQAAKGGAFALALWVVNLQLVARLVLPWVLAAAQPGQMFLYLGCYGIPLGVMYAATTRRTRLLIVVPRAA